MGGKPPYLEPYIVTFCECEMTYQETEDLRYAKHAAYMRKFIGLEMTPEQKILAAELEGELAAAGMNKILEGQKNEVTRRERRAMCAWIERELWG